VVFHRKGAHVLTASASAAPSARPSSGGVPLGELLITTGLITDDQLEAALVTQRDSGGSLGELLVDAGVLTRQDLLSTLAVQLGLPAVDLRHTEPTPEAIALVPATVARSRNVLPLYVKGGRLTAVAASPRPGLELDLELALGLPVTLMVSSHADIERAMSLAYPSLSGIGEEVTAFLATRTAVDLEQAGLDSLSDGAPVVRVVDMLLSQAVRDRASDIHLESRDDGLRVRFRIDGALHDVASLPLAMAAPVAGRLKVMAGMNIVERRRPQDGQIGVTVDGRALDIRVSTVGTVFGEKVVLRLLDRSKPALRLSELGMSPHALREFAEAVASPFGMIVCVGPTGSGKTTTLYATLRSIDARERSITTIEDPVEYVFPDVTQIPINEAAGVTFASGLRAVLRQDPDVILVGEIRDEETARIAITAALTGHLVFSSLHATDSVSALYRFIDMGVEPFLVASSVRAIVAQRLVRRVCTGCQQPHQLGAEEAAFWERIGGDLSTEFVQGQGCNRCGGSGYLERVGLYEVLRVTEGLAERLVSNRSSSEAMRRIAIEEGLITLRDESVRLVAEGQSTVAEVLRSVHAV
jgi:type IV pilus assembly protein PilB